MAVYSDNIPGTRGRDAGSGSPCARDALHPGPDSLALQRPRHSLYHNFVLNGQEVQVRHENRTNSIVRQRKEYVPRDTLKASRWLNNYPLSAMIMVALQA